MPGSTPLRVALTGGIASGKSVCLRRFAALGAPTLDADLLARAVVGLGTPGLSSVVARFGRSVLGPDGTLNRRALASLVFSDAAARRDLEAIIHPAVYDLIESWFAELEATSPPARLGIVDIPLLFETGRDRDFDVVVVAACRPDQQIARLMARDGLDEASARQRLAAQLPIEDKVRRAHFVIDTSGTLSATLAGTDAVWANLKSR